MRVELSDASPTNTDDTNTDTVSLQITDDLPTSTPQFMYLTDMSAAASCQPVLFFH